MKRIFLTYTILFVLIIFPLSLNAQTAPLNNVANTGQDYILEQFELARFEMENDQRRTSMPPEQLFIERCLYLLRPGGRLAIVLPDSILSNPGLAPIRRWILKRARVVASVLLLQKKKSEEMRIEQEMGRPRDYEVFMTTPQAVGHDRRGEVHHLRTPEGELIEYEEPR